MKKVIAIILVCVTMLTTVVIVHAQGEIGSKLTKNSEYEEYLERNWQRIELATSVEKEIMKYYSISKPFEDIYPNYFGGMYINDDATKLVIQIVKKNIPSIGDIDYEFYNKFINMDRSIEIEYVENSFNELNNINNKISKYLTTIKDYNDDITGGYIDVMSNKAVVEIKSNNEEVRDNVVKKVLKVDSKDKTNVSNLLYFKKSGEFSYATDINAGGRYIFTKSDGKYTCSMGFRTTYNGKKGFVTAGHCVANAVSVDVGKVKLLQFANGQNYDYAFVETDSSYTPTNILEYSGTNITKLGVVYYCPTITVNMEIAKVGDKTGYTSGKVTGLNKTFSADGKTTTGLVKSNLKADNGDSGGVVIIPRTDSNGGAVPIGVVSSREKYFLGIAYSMYFTSINDMPEELQSGRY